VPPIVALALGLAVVAFMLRKDIKESRGTSAALWIPFIWVAVAASRPFSYWIHPGSMTSRAQDFNYVLGNPTERNFLIVLMAAGLVVLYRRRHKFSFPFKENSWLYIFYIYALLSVGWADYQGVSIKRWIRAIGDIIMVLVILTEDDQKEAMERVLHRCAIVLIPLSVVFIKWYRKIGVVFMRSSSPMWVGVSTHKNNLALLCAFSALLLIWRILKKWPKKDYIDILLLLMTLYLLQGSRSATSYVVLLVGALVLAAEAMAKGNPKRLNAMVVVGLVVLVLFEGLLLSASNISSASFLFSATGRNSSFTDRVPLWQELLSRGRHHAILGAGFGGFWLGSLTGLWDKFVWHPTNGHNGYLDTFLDLGIIGLIVLFFFLVRTYIKTKNGIEDHWGIVRLQLAFIVMILLHNVTETSLTMPTNYLWILVLMAALVVVKKRAPQESATPPGAPGWRS
jgi:exopolysaccharide production protein ExoQ